MRRFESFDDDELRELWDGLTMDDGLRYSVEPEDQPTHSLATELHVEAERRGMVGGDFERWGMIL